MKWPVRHITERVKRRLKIINAPSGLCPRFAWLSANLDFEGLEAEINSDPCSFSFARVGKNVENRAYLEPINPQTTRTTKSTATEYPKNSWIEPSSRIVELIKTTVTVNQ